MATLQRWNTPLTQLGIILGVVFFYRLVLVFSVVGLLGVDGGAYGLSVNQVLGNEPTGAGFPRPPFAPGWLLVPFWEFLGPDTGYKLWSALASLLPIIPVWLITRRIVGHRWANFAIMFLSIDLLHAEMLVTGALPLIAFGFLGLAWYAMIVLSEDGPFSKKHAALLAVSLGVSPWINQTTAGLALITLPALWIFLQVTQERWIDRSQMYWHVIPPALIGGVVALAALPWYLDVLPVTGVLNYPGPWIYVTNAFDSAWWQFCLAWGLGALVFFKAADYRVRAVALLLPLLGTLLIFLSTDETIINLFYRSRYLIPMPFYVMVTWAVAHLWMPWVTNKLATWRPNLTAYTSIPIDLAIIASICIMGLGFQWNFKGQADYSAMITFETGQALQLYEFYSANSEHKGIVSNSFTLALWISALERVQSPHIWNQQPPVKWQESDKQARCILGWVESCDYREARDNLGVGYVLIEHRFPNLNRRVPGNYKAPPDQWEVTANTPWLHLIYERGTTKLWAIKQ